LPGTAVPHRKEKELEKNKTQLTLYYTCRSKYTEYHTHIEAQKYTNHNTTR